MTLATEAMGSRRTSAATAGIAIVSPMPQEIAPLVSRATIDRRFRLGAMRVWCGRLGETPVVLAATGDGARRAERGLDALLERFAVERVLVLGTSGGLTPGLAEDTLVVGDRITDRNGIVATVDSDLVERALATGARRATLFTADRILGGVEEKKLARACLPGDVEAAVVDLESAAFARVAARRGVALLIVRSVCDPAEEELPLDLNLCLDSEGGVSRSKVLRRALGRPAVIGSLLDLRRRVDRCAHRLADFAEALLAGDEDLA